MKRMLKPCALAALFAGLAGCTSSTSIKWGGKTALRAADGTVIVNKDGTPYYETDGNVYKDSNWLTKREERDVSVKVNADGSYEAGIGSRSLDVSTNGIAMVTGSIESVTKLVSACATAYATIAGGGAQADTVTTVVSKLVSQFVSGGGDTTKATVTTENNTVTVSDGTTCTTCTADGTCTTGACSVK